MAKSKGVGDSIAKITRAVGIVPCGSCEKRKDALNKLFPFKTVNALNDTQIDLLGKLAELSDLELINLYNDVFNIPITLESFGNNIKQAILKDLKKLL